MENLVLEGKMDFREVKLEGVDWTQVTADKERWLVLMKATTTLRIP